YTLEALGVRAITGEGGGLSGFEPDCHGTLVTESGGIVAEFGGVAVALGGGPQRLRARLPRDARDRERGDRRRVRRGRGGVARELRHPDAGLRGRRLARRRRSGRLDAAVLPGAAAVPS